VHTPCKLQPWSSVQSASSGLYESSASSVPAVSDTVKCSSRYTRFQRCFDFQSSIMANLCGGFLFSAFPPCVLASLESRLKMFVDGRFKSHRYKFCSEIFGLGANFFFGQKSHTLRFSIVEVGWLVGCDLLLLSWMYFTQKKLPRYPWLQPKCA